MSDFRIRSLERKASYSGDKPSLDAYVMACLRSRVYPSHDLATLYMKNVLLDSRKDYTVPKTSPYDSIYVPVPYSILMDWVSLGKKLNISIMTQRSQGYVGRESADIRMYYLDIEHFDDFGFTNALLEHRDRAELISFMHESEFDSYFGPPGEAWPQCPREGVWPDIDGRRSWETASYYSTLQFIQIETAFTYEEILAQALLAPQG